MCYLGFNEVARCGNVLKMVGVEESLEMTWVEKCGNKTHMKVSFLMRERNLSSTQTQNAQIDLSSRLLELI